MESNLFIIALLIVLIVLAVIGRGAWKRPKAGPLAEPEPDPAAPAGSKRIYEIAEKVRDAFWAAARPGDLFENDDFRAGIELLSSSQYRAADLADYFCGDNAIIASFAAAALTERDDGGAVRGQILANIGTVAIWPLYFGLRYLQGAIPDLDQAVAPVLCRTTAYLDDRQSRIFLNGFVEERLRAGEIVDFDYELDRLPQEQRDRLRNFLASLGPFLRDPLLRAFQAWSDRHVDYQFLAAIGTIWGADEVAKASGIIDHDALTRFVSDGEEALTAEPPGSLLLVGEPGVGKTSFAMKLAARLHERGWMVFQAGHAELVAGQSYIGQLEERVKGLLAQLTGSRRILWIIPDFPNLAYTGVHRYSPVSVLDTIIAPIRRGDIVVIGVAERAGFERLTVRLPGVENALNVVPVAPMSAKVAKQLALDWFKSWAGKNEKYKAVVDEAWELAEQFLTATAAPGSVFKLLNLACDRASADPARSMRDVGIDDLMISLSRMTGLPVGLFDDRRTLDLDDLQRTFNQRVLGQGEAVQCLIERVAMIKAGLTDPGRPAGVFLFAGPTGTGKTEMAKTLAEWLFGSASRMLRLDMSEFQRPEDLDRILGNPEMDDREALVNRIREQPFSVVLLDEFEKAHPRVWDVFLQVFDDGRLSDRSGRTADFRHAIIILTSNLGSVIPTGSSIGFRFGTEVFETESVIGAVETAFRKEFLNRLDRVVVFRPLTRELMRGILEKELNVVLKRRGLRSRPWAVEWDEAAVEFLLEKGVTPDLGARPLKRAIERYLLSPLATTIVRHQVPAGDQFLFVTRGDGGLEVQFVDPDEPAGEAEAAAPPEAEARAGEVLTLAGIALEPQGAAQEIAFLRTRYDDLVAVVKGEGWQERKAALLAAMQESGFWGGPERHHVLDMIERRDRVESGLKRAGSLIARLGGKGRRQLPRQLVRLLSQNLYLLQLASDDIAEERPSDALILVTSARASGPEAAETVAFARDIAGMYRAWAKRRNMRLDVIEETLEADKPSYRFLAAVVGFGAHTILAPEQGLHVLERPGKSEKGFERSRAMVRIAQQTGTADTGGQANLESAADRVFGHIEPSGLKIVRRYRKEPSPLVRDSVGGWRTGRIDQVLGGDFDLFAAQRAAESA